MFKSVWFFPTSYYFEEPYLRTDFIFIWSSLVKCALILIYFVGKSKLRDIFMKTDNYMGGRYFAEMIKVTLILCFE